jgi:hypothetical protein
MKNKIKTARKILNKMSESNLKNGETDIILKLKEITDRAELTYNDVKVKRGRTQAAFQSMKEIENRFDELLREAKHIKNN